MTASEYPDALSQHYRLHWYILDRVLGEGGFGITYLARDTNLDQPVAIKEYLPVEIAARRADAAVRARTEDQQERFRWGLDRFIKEARTLARFDHPNIVRVHSVFEFNGTAYMVMRLEEGETLESMLERRRTLPEEEIVRIVMPILDGLEIVHNAGFIHRDIKPDNILIRADGIPVLLDFGSARHSLGHVRTVTILVAPGYAPFEQYYSTGENQGPWTDIYGLGATCYRAIAGAPPMDAIARSKGILGSTRELLVPARAVGQGRYSEAMLQAVDHALEFAERDRPQNIAAWRRELRASAAATPGAAAPQSANISPRPNRPLVGTAALIAMLSAVAVVGGAVGAYLMMRSPTPSPTPAAQMAAAEEAAARAKADADQRRQRKAEEDRLAREKLEQEQVAKKRAEEDRLAREKSEQERLAREKSEQERLARERAAQERLARQRLEQERLAKRKAEEDKVLRASTSKERARAPMQRPPAGDGAAFAYYRGLANGGDAEAALKLGEMFESGRGTAPNNNWAYLWYAVAEQRGVPGAKAKRDAVAARLQPKEIEQIDRQARSLARPAD